MLILNNKWGGYCPTSRKEASTGLIVLSPQTLSKGGQRWFKGVIPRG